MSPASTKTPAAAPIAAPLARPVTFSVTSALASAISSRTSSEAFSVTSWIAFASSDVVWSGILVDQPLEDAGDQERAGEGDPRERPRAARAGSLAPRRQCRRLGRRPPPRAAAAGSVSEPRPGAITFAPETVAGACRPGVALSTASRSASPACSRRLARLGLGALGLLVGLALLARELLFLLLGGLDGVVRLGRLLLGAACVGLAQLCTQLGAAGLGPRRARPGPAPRGRPRPARPLWPWSPRQRSPACAGTPGCSRSGGASHSWVRSGSSRLTPADLPQRCGGIPPRRRASSRSRPGPRCRRAGQTRPGA